MQKPIYNSPAELKSFLSERGMGMQKKFGQNFLIDENIRLSLIKAMDLNEHSTVWEIGPGLGAMTDLLIQSNAHVTAFEIDRGFINVLQEIFARNANFKLVEGDVLKTWKTELETSGKPDCFFGNLPYNIAATLIANTIEKGVIFDTCVFTVQKEVGERMNANCGTNYSSFSVLCQSFYNIKPIRNISPSAFWPRPNIDSQAVLFKAKTNKENIEDTSIFFSLLRGLFSARRKTLKNNLMKWLKQHNKNASADDILTATNFKPNLRAENLLPTDFIKLSNFIAQLKD